MSSGDAARNPVRNAWREDNAPGNLLAMKPRTLDLFCGGGGSSWGAKNAGAEIVGGVDAWEMAASTFATNFPCAQVFSKKLHKRSNRLVVRGISHVDLLLASPECTNHTCARGSRERDEESRATASYVLNFVGIFRPRWIVVENVTQMQSWSGYPRFIQKLRRSYRVSEQILDAANFGVPQRRRRLFILCDAEQAPPNLEAMRQPDIATAESILDPVGTWNRRLLYNGARAEATLARAKRAIRELGEGIPFLLVYYGSDGAGGWQTLERPLRTLTTLDRFGLVEWDVGVPTLRMLQVSELKRAMGFDTSYRLSHGTRRDQVKILGNGVCPPVMEHIVGALTGVETSGSHTIAVAAE